MNVSIGPDDWETSHTGDGPIRRPPGFLGGWGVDLLWTTR